MTYTQQAGRTLDTTGIQKGIDSFMKNRKEAIVHKATELSNQTYSDMIKPWETVIAGDVSDPKWALDASNLVNMTSGDALELYKNLQNLKVKKFIINFLVKEHLILEHLKKIMMLI